MMMMMSRGREQGFVPRRNRLTTETSACAHNQVARSIAA